eukprot:scaffold130549_cov31-Tisochrysis_lutea.AAC.3
MAPYCSPEDRPKAMTPEALQCMLEAVDSTGEATQHILSLIQRWVNAPALVRRPLRVPQPREQGRRSSGGRDRHADALGPCRSERALASYHSCIHKRVVAELREHRQKPARFAPQKRHAAPQPGNPRQGGPSAG